MTRITLGVTILLCSLSISANERQEIFDKYLNFHAMVEGETLTANWLEDGSSFWYAAVDGSFKKVDPASNEVSDVPASDPMVASVPPALPKLFDRRGWFGMVTPAPEMPSPDGKWTSLLQDDNVAVRAMVDGRIISLTSDGTAEKAWDVESMRLTLGAGLSVSYVPFSSWSPNSLKLWATRVDRGDLPHKYEVRYQKVTDELIARPFTIAGGKLSHTQPYIVDILSREPMPLDVETNDYYFIMLGWLPDSSGVHFARVSRDFKTLEIMEGNAQTGAVRTLVTDRADTFVKIQHDVIVMGNTGYTGLADGSGFLYESTRDGWNHLYHYDNEGNLVRQLTRGEFTTLQVDSVDLTNRWVYFTGHGDADRPYDTHLYRASLSGGRVQQLTDAPGQHVAQFSPSFEYFIDTYSKPDAAPRIDLRKTDGTLVRTLQEADISALNGTGWTPTEEFVVKAADGETDLWGVMHKPYDFDPAKRYPVLEYLYAGPQIVTADRSFGLSPSRTANFPRAMAQLGYIVVTLDARGTPERSKGFQDVVYRAWGQNEIPDHAAALKQLGERHDYMDMSRVGLWGHSWGGYFALRGLATAPDTYHAAVSSAPGYDPYAGLLYEPYLDMPDQAKDAYEHAAVINFVDGIKGKLMIIGGTADYATFSEWMKVSRRLIDLGIDHEQVVLPGEGHGYVGAAENYFFHKVADFFGRHLKP